VKTLVAGIGSTILGDDGVGAHVARRLEHCLSAKDHPSTGEVAVMELGTAGLTLLDLAEGFDRLIVIDAIMSDAPAGTIHELSGDQVMRSLHLGAGHDADLPTTISLGRKLLGRHMPERITVLAVEVKSTTVFRETLSPEVEAAIPAVVEKVQDLLSTIPE
jgi:hydrogenase maturation protease